MHPNGTQKLIAFPCLVLLAITATTAIAQQDAPPAATRTSQAESDDLQARLVTVVGEIKKQMAEHHVPGAGLAIVRGDDVLLCIGIGQANIETGEPATGDTVFAIGSSTKAFTATLIGMLVDDGVLEWDDQPQLYLPEFQLRDEDANAQVTFRDLLSHQTGLSRMGLLWAAGRLDRDDIIAHVQHAELLHEFRSQFHYSNINYIVAGAASARAADTTWERLVQQRLLDPLQMTGATVSVNEARTTGLLARGYRWDEDKQDFVAENLRDIDVAAPAGAINASAREMANWLRFQINRGVFDGTRLISSDTLEQTWKPQVEIAPGMSYGLGWMVGDWRGRTLIQHGGNIDGYAAQVAFLPDERVGYVLLTNTSFNALQATGNTAVFEALLEDHSDDELPEIDYAPFLGKYIADFGPFQDQRFTVQVKDGDLAVDVPGQMLYVLNPPDDEGRWTFAITDAISVSFDRNEQGDVIAMKMDQGGLTFELPREGVELEPEVSLSEVRDYLGAYHDERLDADIEIRMHNGRLAADVPGQMVFDLRETEAGRWVFRATEDISITFHRGDDGAVDALTLTERGVERVLPRVADAEASDAEVPTLEEVLALHNEAHGTANLAQLDSLVLRGAVRFVHQGLTGRFRIAVRGLDSQRVTIDLGPCGILDMAATARAGWSWSSFEPYEELEGDYLRAIQRRHPLTIARDLRDVADDVKLQKVTDVDGRPHYAVRVNMSERVTSTVYIDVETGLVSREDLTMMARGIGPMPMEVRYSDYRDVAGVMLPLRVEIEEAHNGRMIMTVESIEPNAELADDAFDRPVQLQPIDAT